MNELTESTLSAGSELTAEGHIPAAEPGEVPQDATSYDGPQYRENGSSATRFAGCGNFAAGLGSLVLAIITFSLVHVSKEQLTRLSEQDDQLTSAIEVMKDAQKTMTEQLQTSQAELEVLRAELGVMERGLEISTRTSKREPEVVGFKSCDVERSGSGYTLRKAEDCPMLYVTLKNPGQVTIRIRPKLEFSSQRRWVCSAEDAADIVNDQDFAIDIAACFNERGISREGEFFFHLTTERAERGI